MQEKMDRGGRGKYVLIALLLVFLAVIIGAGIYLKVMHDSSTFFSGTKVNGYEAGEMTPAEVQAMLMDKYSACSVRITEKGEESFTGSLEDFGYRIDGDRLSGLLEKAYTAQREDIGKLLSGLFNGSAFVLQVPFEVDEEKLSRAASRESLKEERYPSEDAYLSYDEENKSYSIVPEIYGNDLSDEELKALVRTQIDAFTQEKQAGDVVETEIPEELYYLPEVLSTDEGLNTQRDVYNQYCKAEINYQFGSQIRTLGWDTIRDWISIEGGAGVLREDKLTEYVQELEAEYNTRYHSRTFHTSVGTDIEFPDYMNEYGYTINEEAEIGRLAEDIRSNTSVTREPVYYTVTDEYENPVFFTREGTDDLAGTYVEVNLSAQHLWFYKYGSLIVESDVVSGCVARGTETQTGVFPLAYKESPSVLTGGNAENGYSTPVQYWMPFYEGQGLHDANWRGSFGGQIYVSSGSHGCVNLPPAVAAAIYGEIEPGMAIIIYH